MKELPSLLPRPLPDFISQLWRNSPQLGDKIWEWPGNEARKYQEDARKPRMFRNRMERNQTEPEVIDAQYECGHQTWWLKPELTKTLTLHSLTSMKIGEARADRREPHQASVTFTTTYGITNRSLTPSKRKQEESDFTFPPQKPDKHQKRGAPTSAVVQLPSTWYAWLGWCLLEHEITLLSYSAMYL